jgi:hypothetical protein
MSCKEGGGVMEQLHELFPERKGWRDVVVFWKKLV